MTEPRSEAVEQFAGYVRRWVDGVSVRDVEAEARVWQHLQEGLHLVGDAPRGLPVIHVLEHQPGAESSIGVRFHEAVRVGDDGADPQWKLAQLLHEGRLVSSTANVDTLHASSTSAGQSPREASKTPVEIPTGWWSAREWVVASAVVAATDLRYLAPTTIRQLRARKRVPNGYQNKQI